MTLVNDRRIIRYAIEQHNNLVADLNTTLGPQDFGTIQEFQPIPGYVGELGAQRGGNVLGLERSTSNKLFLVFSALLQGENADAQVPRVAQQISAMVQKIEHFSKSLGLWEDFLYMNYAQPTGDPLGSYGAANVDFMKQVAKKYDPQGFLQSRVPGGFKISRVD